MARARNKEELLSFGKNEYDILIKHVGELSEVELTEKYVFDNRAVKDIVAHLHAWHMLMLRWYEEGMKGEKPEIPAPGYTFKDTPRLNEDLFQEYKDAPLDKVMKMFKSSHEQLVKLIEKHTNEELTEKKRYTWTGTTNLASYLASAVPSHYAWANGLIKKFRKTL